ncbi:MAG: hypothetical protein JWR07_4412 [Nevskia sp.]|nr:hypothetical protein [Nevskia sp.]
MLDNKALWLAQNLALAAFWLAALVLLVLGQSGHWLVLVAAVILAAHVLEVPLAFMVLRGRGAAPLRVTLMTLVFGYTWWLPARRGIYAVRRT